MAATTTAQLNSILDQIIADHPQILFVSGDVPHWSPETNTVFYGSLQDSSDLSVLLHELGHGLLGHHGYDQDIQLPRMEREAWDAALTLAPRYQHSISESDIEDALDSYRDWLYSRSRCPTCHNPGIQKKTEPIYLCLLCHTKWQANEARQCGLKRYVTQK